MKTITALLLVSTSCLCSAQSSTPRPTNATFATFWVNGQPRHHLIVDLTNQVSVSVFGWNTPNPKLWIDYTVASARTALGACDLGICASSQRGRGSTGIWAAPSIKHGRLRASSLAYYLMDDRGNPSVFMPNARAGYQVGRVNLGLELTGSTDKAGWHQQIGPTLRYELTPETFIRISALSGSKGKEIRVFYGVKF